MKLQVHKNKGGRPPRKYYQSVAYTIDYRGRDDDQLCFLFLGIYDDQLEDIFGFLCGKQGSGIANGFRIGHEHSPRPRLGFAYRRTIVFLDHPNFYFSSVEDMCILIEAIGHRLITGQIDHYGIDDFLNLKGRRKDRIIKHLHPDY